jgi:hypothetical protein
MLYPAVSEFQRKVIDLWLESENGSPVWIPGRTFEKKGRRSK